MPKARKPRPSFSPATSATTSEPGAATGWVYRSEEPPSKLAAPSPPDTGAPKPGHGGPVTGPRRPEPPSCWTSVANALTLPFALMILTALPTAQGFGRRRPPS